MRKPPWLVWGLGLVALAIALFITPTQFEGPVLLPISPGHAISALDSVALAPLLIGTALLFGGLWQRREQLGQFVCRSPGVGSGGAFIAGLGLGLLLASAFSSFWWWWAVGVGLFTAVLIGALLVAMRR